MSAVSEDMVEIGQLCLCSDRVVTDEVMPLNLQDAAWSYTAGIRPPSATRDKAPSQWFFSARATKGALALYTIAIDRMYDSKA